MRERLNEAARRFLELPRVAVVGVSRDPQQAANFIYRRLKESPRRQVFAVNPNAQLVEGDPCYPDVAAIPGGVEGAVIVTSPSVAAAAVDGCAAAGVRQVWLHRSFGAGSVSAEAIERCRQHGLSAIAGACPMMYCDGADAGHRCMKAVLGFFGRLPAPMGA